MERYTEQLDCDIYGTHDAIMEKDIDGEYVKYEDVEEMKNDLLAIVSLVKVNDIGNGSLRGFTMTLDEKYR